MFAHRDDKGGTICISRRRIIIDCLDTPTISAPLCNTDGGILHCVLSLATDIYSRLTINSNA